MNKRIKKKVAIRKMRKELRKNETDFSWRRRRILQGMENMYARRIATIRKGGMK
ncbi:MAG: hypothetical protein ACLT2S_00005 [Christensenellales bacterium]